MKLSKILSLLLALTLRVTGIVLLAQVVVVSDLPGPEAPAGASKKLSLAA